MTHFMHTKLRDDWRNSSAFAAESQMHAVPWTNVVNDLSDKSMGMLSSLLMCEVCNHHLNRSSAVGVASKLID
jgi:hypothetical protein